MAKYKKYKMAAIMAVWVDVEAKSLKEAEEFTRNLTDHQTEGFDALGKVTARSFRSGRIETNKDWRKILNTIAKDTPWETAQ